MPRLATHFFFQFTTEGNVEKENRKKHGKKITAKKQLFERNPAAQATSGTGGTAAPDELTSFLRVFREALGRAKVANQIFFCRRRTRLKL